jgi:hypothetical protein
MINRWNVQIEVTGIWTTLDWARAVTTVEAYRIMLRERDKASGRIRMQPARALAAEYPAVKP